MPIWKRNLIICWIGAIICVAGMSLVLPFLPLYLEQLGVHETGALEQWSGLAFGVTFLMAAIASPIWGRLADQHGRKLMLIRASGGMAIVTTLMAFVTEPWQLVLLRFLMGAVSGYVSASITLVATQTPKEHSGYALGWLSTGSIAGGLIGPLLGGYLAETIGLRAIFLVCGACMTVGFLLTWLFLIETFKPAARTVITGGEVWRMLPQPRLLLAMFFTSFMLQLATMSIEPIVTIYVRDLLGNGAHVALMAGLVVASSGFASMLVAPKLGRLADRVGPGRVLVASLLLGGVFFVPQALVHNAWELTAWRFIFGLAAAAMFPAINALVRTLAPDAVAGRVYGYNQSAMYLGNICGPILGGVVAAHFGLVWVFYSTAALLVLNGLFMLSQTRAIGRMETAAREAIAQAPAA